MQYIPVIRRLLVVHEMRKKKSEEKSRKHWKMLMAYFSSIH